MMAYKQTILSKGFVQIVIEEEYCPTTCIPSIYAFSPSDRSQMGKYSNPHVTSRCKIVTKRPSQRIYDGIKMYLLPCWGLTFPVIRGYTGVRHGCVGF